ncbi:MAG TPA: hypothetical protein VFI69_03085, partial [Candidatus Limnocylindrales bacterium]|nr:hypothetical protein [Candidatus Limnocylindrales bacterium]
MSTTRPAAPSTLRRPFGLALVALSILALLPAPAIAAAPARGSDTIRPTIHYEEALAHAHDTTRFTAG